MDPTKSAELIKLNPKYLIGLCAASGFTVLAPKPWLRAMGLANFQAEYPAVAGIVLLLSGALLVGHGLAHGGSALNAWVVSQNRLWKYRKRLNNLSAEEKELLRRYLDSGSKTLALSVEDGIRGGLVRLGVIYQSASLSSHGFRFDHNIQPWAWSYLQKNPHLLSLPETTERD